MCTHATDLRFVDKGAAAGRTCSLLLLGAVQAGERCSQGQIREAPAETLKRQRSAVDPPRVLQLPAYQVVQMSYTGARPPAAAFFDHWRRFQGWCARRGLKSALSDVALIGYEPPGRPGARAFFYQVCVPVTEE